MPSLHEKLAEDRRGIVLRVLVDQGDFGLNDGVIQDALDRFGHHVSIDVVRIDLAWLRDAGLLRCDVLETTNMWIANLTKRGEECAQGRVKVPGVKRPSPKE